MPSLFVECSSIRMTSLNGKKRLGAVTHKEAIACCWVPSTNDFATKILTSHQRALNTTI